MKRFLVLAVMAVAGASQAVVIWDQSGMINRPGGGTGAIAGQHLSMLETAAQGGTPSNQNILGYGVQNAPPATVNVIADDFTVGAGGAIITGFSVFSYVTGATAPSVTGVNWAIGSAPTRTLTSTTVASSFWSVGGLAVYRVANAVTTDANRRVQITTVTGLNISLGAGTHYLSWNVTPGNFSPCLPSTLATFGKNGMQSTVAAPTFVNVLDGTAPNQFGADHTFIIEGNPVPEPATMAALGLGAVALIRRRRK